MKKLSLVNSATPFFYIIAFAFVAFSATGCATGSAKVQNEEAVKKAFNSQRTPEEKAAMLRAAQESNAKREAAQRNTPNSTMPQNVRSQIEASANKNK